MEKAQGADQKRQEAQEQKKIIKGMLSQLVQLENWHDALMDFKADNGLSGKITDHYNGYGLFM